MNYRKTTIALIGILLCITVLAACGSGSASDDIAAPVGMKCISPDTAEYYLYVNEDWKSDISTGVVTAYFSDTDPSNISMMAFSVSKDTTPQAYFEQYEPQFRQIYGNYKLEESGETLLGGVPAMSFVYTGTFGLFGNADEDASVDTGVGSPNGEYRFSSVIAVRDGNLYLLTYTAKTANYDSHLSDFVDAVSNFRFAD